MDEHQRLWKLGMLLAHTLLRSRSTAWSYKLGIVYIKFVGTHKQYDAVDTETVDNT